MLKGLINLYSTKILINEKNEPKTEDARDKSGHAIHTPAENFANVAVKVISTRKTLQDKPHNVTSRALVPTKPPDFYQIPDRTGSGISLNAPTLVEATFQGQLANSRPLAIKDQPDFSSSRGHRWKLGASWIVTYAF